MIEALVKAGHAYAADGHVLFDVSSKADYGKLSQRPLNEMIAGARVEVAPYKKNPMDFVLWKPSDALTPGWASPWGRGRPGWHIECSAMGEALLGETFDIHGGGIDLMFPHHENEIAQSESAHHEHPLAKVWMHNGFLQVEGEKMSKSLGNFVTINELLVTDKFGGQAWRGVSLRLAMLGVHYRQPINWTLDRLNEADDEVVRFTRATEMLNVNKSRIAEPFAYGPPTPDIVEALCDDLNLPEALARIRARRSTLFGGGEDHPDAKRQAVELLSNLHFLGLDSETAPRSLDEQILAQIEARTAARKAKNFKESDRIRDELLAKGIVLKDGPTGTTWEVKR
jgi:cysteinyl-tRNA synthetase